MKPIPKRLSLLAMPAIIAIAATTACMDLDGPPASPAEPGFKTADPAVGLCEADGECPGDQACRGGLCSAPLPAGDLTVDFHLRAPDQGGAPTQIITDQTLEDGRFDLAMENIPRRTGQLRTSDGENAPDGVILFVDDRGPNAAQQRPLRQGEFTVRPRSGDDEAFYIADDPRWPRIALTDQLPTSSDGDWNFEIPAFVDLRRVTGTVERDLLGLLDLITEPVEGARIFAEGQIAGYRSPTAITDEDGRFALRLPPSDAIFDIRIEPSPLNSIIPFASFSAAIDTDTDDLTLSLGEIELDLLTITGALNAEPVAGHSPDWESIRVEFARALDIGELILSPVIADGGLLEFDVLTGTYDVQVQTHPGSPWGATSTTVGLLDTLGDVDIELPRRPRVEGTLVNAEGTPVADAEIEVLSTDGETRIPAQFTDNQGRFVLWADPGDYLLLATAPADQGLPIHGAEISIDSAQEQSLEVVVPPGVVATGTISDAQSNGAAHTQLRARHPRFRDLTIAEASADEDGEFTLLFSPVFFED